MLKENKGTLTATSVITLLPMLIGLALWSRLPDTIAVHFGKGGVPNGWSSKPFAVFGLPLLLLAIHWVCVLGTAADPKRKSISKKALGLVLWFCPLVSLLCNSIVYAIALGVALDVGFLTALFLGVVFIAVGNYLPKCQQSYTLGIRLPWTLDDEQNWNHTHRFAGRVWVAGGVLIAATAFLESQWLFLALIVLMVALPAVYSFLYYRKAR